jgi:hypothetical protein
VRTMSPPAAGCCHFLAIGVLARLTQGSDGVSVSV